MSKEKKSFVLYSDLINVVEKLVIRDRKNKTNYAGELFLHILEYVNDKDPIPIDFIVEMAFEPVKQQLKRDLKKYEKVAEKNSINGRLGGRPKKPTGLIGLSEKPKKADSGNDNDNGNDNVNEKKKKKGVPPSFDSFLNHAQKKAEEKNIFLDTEKVKTKFEAWLENGWCDLNGKKIINWKVKITSNLTYWQKVGANNKPITGDEHMQITF
jgi:hypothetical protein